MSYKTLGEYHYFDDINEYKPKPSYIIPVDENKLIEELKAIEDDRKSYKYSEWIPE